MKSVTDESRRAAYTRIAMAVLSVPFAAFFAVVVAGVGYLPLGGLAAIAPLYLLGVLVLDVLSAFTGRYRARPSYLVWWGLAAIPALAWNIWLMLSS